MNKGLRALTTSKERQEIRVIGKKALKTPGLRLKRTFNQSDFQGSYIKYWRVVGPAGHRSIDSDLSLQGLKDWGLI